MASQMTANQLLDQRMHPLNVETESSLSHWPTRLMCWINAYCLSRDMWHSSFYCSLCLPLSNNNDLFIFLLWFPGFIDTIKKFFECNNSKTKVLHVPSPTGPIIIWMGSSWTSSLFTCLLLLLPLATGVRWTVMTFDTFQLRRASLCWWGSIREYLPVSHAFCWFRYTLTSYSHF